MIRVLSSNKLTSVIEKDDSSVGSGSSGSTLAPISYVKTRPTNVGNSKWGRLLGGKSLDLGTEVNTSNRSTLMRAVSIGNLLILIF